MTDEQAAFIRGILANPADDTVRLVYADWLDEHGEPERAEFIRVQIALAARSENGGDETCRMTCAPPDFEGCPCRERMCRDWELQHVAIRENWFSTLGFSRRVSLDVKGFLGWHAAGGKGRCLMRGVVRRGFVSRIELSCDIFRIHAPHIFASLPVTAVGLSGVHPDRTDREPGFRDYFYWFATARNRIAFLAEGGHLKTGLDSRRDTEAECLDDLSRACVAYGREQVGLEPMAVAA